jgi:hypothetical protein
MMERLSSHCLAVIGQREELKSALIFDGIESLFEFCTWFLLAEEMHRSMGL